MKRECEEGQRAGLGCWRKNTPGPVGGQCEGPGAGAAGQEGRDGREEGRGWAPSYRKHFHLSPQWTGSTGHLAHRRAPRDFPRKIISQADLREKGRAETGPQSGAVCSNLGGRRTGVGDFWSVLKVKGQDLPKSLGYWGTHKGSGGSGIGALGLRNEGRKLPAGAAGRPWREQAGRPVDMVRCCQTPA